MYLRRPADGDFAPPKEVNKFINECLHSFPVMTYEEAKICLADKYETTFGIFNHSDPNRNPLCSILMHEAENVFEDSALADMLIEFAVEDIGELWKISLDTFMNLPKPIADLMRKLRPMVTERRLKNMQAAMPDVPKF